METLDSPVQLKYNNGNLFPANLVMIAYTIIALSIYQVIIGNYLAGVILFILPLPIVFNRNFTEISIEEDFIQEFTLYAGIIKIGKKSILSNYKYITAMPLIESNQVYASTSNSTTISKSYTTVTLFKERLKGKRIIQKFDSKNEAEEMAKRIGDRLKLKYFHYDPKLVRQVLLGERTL